MKQFYFLLMAMLSMNCATAQWEWQNPLPQGNSLNSIFFPCVDTGFAVGDCGTIMKTVNAGIDWELLGISDSIDLNDVFFTDSQNGFIGGYKIYRDPSGNNDVLGVIKATRDGGITWSEVNMPLTLCVTSIYFPNADTGYAACYNQILKTTDGGNYWYSIAGITAADIFFIDCNTGFATCQFGHCGSFFKTTDGGLSWTETTYGSGNSICFINDSIGFVASGGMNISFGYGGSVSKTNDGGLNWTEVIPNTSICFNSICFTGDDTGYAVGITNAEEGIIMKTTDGGDNWQTIVSGGIPGLNSIFFTGNNIGFVAGSSGILRKTIDAGTTWDGLPDGTTESLKSVYFTNENIGFAVGEHETILKTSNGGENWTSIYNGTERCLNSVYFTDANTGYIAGEEGIIYKTVDAGINWSLTQPISETLLSVHFPSSSVGYAVSDKIILKTENAGSEWSVIEENALPNYHYTSLFFPDETTGYVTGFYDTINHSPGFILKTSNGGQTWSRIKTIWDKLYTVYFTDLQTGYAAGRAYVYYTTDGGMNWTLNGQFYDIQSIFFPSKDIGYVVGNRWLRGIGITHNGGLDWELVETGTYNKLNSVYFINDSTGYLVGDHGTILKTTNGGGSALSVMEHPKIQDGLSIYPNPATGSITINTKLPGTIQILSLSGQELIKQRITGQTTQIDISNLSSGIYLVKVLNGQGVRIGKIVKVSSK